MIVSRRILAVVTGGVLLVCYASTIRGMIGQWSTDEDMGHGFLVPVVAGWIVWRERGQWAKLPAAPSWWGLAILAGAAMLHAVAAVGVGLFAASVALVVSVVGAIAALGGFGFLRAWRFPLLLTVFMLPKLAIVYNQVTLPLQLIASRLAAAMLRVIGAGVILEGNILEISGRRIFVAEACSGIRYLLPLAFLALLVAYLGGSKPWVRAAMVLLAIPLAIVANAVRVAAAAWVPALTTGTPHAVAGWIIFVFCLAGLVAARSLMDALHGRFAS
jgi:exosortase